MNDESRSTDPTSASVNLLVGALNDMRDKLVMLALTLHDYKFSLESPDRQALDQLSQDLIDKAKRLEP